MKHPNDGIVREIVERYGDTLDLRSSPYLIVEIIQQYGPQIAGNPAAECQPPAGPPPRGGLDPDDLMRDLRAALVEVERLATGLHQSLPRSAP
jgi:hypothetical protein